MPNLFQLALIESDRFACARELIRRFGNVVIQELRDFIRPESKPHVVSDQPDAGNVRLAVIAVAVSRPLGAEQLLFLVISKGTNADAGFPRDFLNGYKDRLLS